MTSNTMIDIQKSWTQAFADQSESSFADTFADNVVLEASVLVRPIEGRDCVKSIMATASKVYEALTFTRQVESDQQTYLEWDAKAFGGQTLSGVTILTKNPDGLIVHIAIHHRPLSAVLRFSIELRDRLKSKIKVDYFYAGK
ncbi:nuclear transport factor 2 family protein [Nostoc sp. FACHB-133]|nr:nuclear transport factor 2 family protein [Nostoc sp. FACHB-133]